MFHHEASPASERNGPATRTPPDRRSSSTGPWQGAVARLVEQFVEEWRRGERPRAEAFLARHPLLADRPAAAIRIIYEEVFLRRDEGEEVTLTELAGRFPRWQDELEVLLDCDRLLGEGPAPPAFPETGETLGDYVLLRELGRGARGRCFLAAQPTLSDRRVALKVTPDDHAEHLSLARLQHTHIMPLYSEHEFPERRLRTLCMPYLGGGSLARILDELASVPAERRSGQSLLEALDAIGNEATPWVQVVEGPARRFLGQSSYIQAVCWIGTCLADALSYAHERGLLHLDIKPSNVLLAADGQPMLLDFHLAREPFSGDRPPLDGVGGTPGYMSPEQEALVDAMDTGRPAPTGLDARSDIYSLGLVLAEMLKAEAWEVTTGMPGDRRIRQLRFLPGVSTGLADIIRRCLATDPTDRYPDATALAEDLRRHMADRPLAGVPNRSLRERWAKWVRRQPHGFLVLRIALLATGLIAATAVVVWFTFLAPRLRGAEQSLADGRALLERRSYADASRTLTRGAALIEGLPGVGGLEVQLTEALRLTTRLDEADRLHRLVDRLRLAESADDRSGASARQVEEHCLMLWARRHSLLDRRGLPVDRELEEQLRRDLLDVAVIGSYLRVRRQTGQPAIAAAHRAGLDLLDEAEALLGPSHVLYLARRAHAAALGLSQMADSAARNAKELPPRTAWDHDAAGRILLAAGDLAGAQAQFERALELRPQDVWPNFHQGVCAFRRGRYDEALGAFRICVALAPDRAECYYNRALALAALKRNAEADRDFNRARTLDPSLVASRHPRIRAEGKTQRTTSGSH